MPDLHLLTYWSLRRLTRNFIYVDYTTRMIHNPEQFAMSQDLKRWRWMSRLPLGLLDKLIVFVPNFNWLLVKPGEH